MNKFSHAKCDIKSCNSDIYHMVDMQVSNQNQ